MPEIEILKNLFFIQRGFLNGNHFVYRSDNPVLIDSAYIADFDQTEKAISQLGVNLAEVALIISTHTHCDHIGGNHAIQQRSGCEIAVHKFGKYFIEPLGREGIVSAIDGPSSWASIMCLMLMCARH